MISLGSVFFTAQCGLKYVRNGPQISSLVPIQTDGAIVTVCIEKKGVLEEAQFG